jgi:hypothetical protein
MDTEFPEPRIRLDSIALASLDQHAIARDTLTEVAAALQIPPQTTATPLKPRSMDKPLIFSSIARGSSSKNDGTAIASVITVPTRKGAIRKMKRMSAERSVEYL